MEEQVPFSKDEEGQSLNQPSQKNKVGNLDNVQNARIGDETHHHYYSSQSALPKELTLSLPKINPADLVGREKDLEQLHELLNKEKRVVVVNGLGGVGKTTLAQAYTGKYYDNYKHIVWITQTSESIVNDFFNTEGLLRMLEVEMTTPDPEQLFRDIIIKLKTIVERPNLLVIDNAEQSLSGYRYLLPGQPNWHLLVTSREVLDEFYPKQLDFLDQEQAVQLFKKHYTLPKLKEDEINELVRAVDYHTLTIEILAKTAKVQRYDSVKLKRAIEQDLRANVKVGRQEEQVERIGSYLGTVFNLSRLNEVELWLMKQFVCLPYEFHDYELIYELTVDEESPHVNIFSEIISGLAQKGWLLHNQETDGYKIHHIIAEVVKKQHEISIDDVSNLIDAISKKTAIDQSQGNPAEKFPWVPFGKSVLEQFLDSSSKKIAVLQNNLALVLQDLGDYTGARALLTKAIQSDEKNLGSEHPTTVVCYSNLATVLRDLGDYEGARALMEKVVQSNEKNFGPEHTSTAVSYSIMAMVLQSLGDYEEAKALLEKAVQSDEKNFGPDHPKTVRRYSNLATVLHDLGDFAGARVLMERAVRFGEKNFGLEHPSTAIRYSNLAMMLKDMEEYEQALELCERALNIFRKTLPDGHPHIEIAAQNYELIKSSIQE